MMDRMMYRMDGENEKSINRMIDRQTHIMTDRTTDRTKMK